MSDEEEAVIQLTELPLAAKRAVIRVIARLGTSSNNQIKDVIRVLNLVADASEIEFRKKGVLIGDPCSFCWEEQENEG